MVRTKNSVLTTSKVHTELLVW